jgi:hypothetical protein
MRAFEPRNPKIWALQGFWGKAYMLWSHCNLIPMPIRRIVTVWRINRTPGPRWEYPWERRR